MRGLSIIPLVLMSLVSFPSWGLTMDDLVQREGLYYQKFTDVPFTGEIDEGLERGELKNGNQEGQWVRYHENGQLFYKVEYKNGEREGPWVVYHKNGQLEIEGNYRNGKLEGPWVGYHKNGQLSFKGEYKNGEQEGPWVYYWNNGHLNSKGDYKNSKREGTWVFFNTDGTKRMSKLKSGAEILDEGSGVYRDGVKVGD